MTKASLVWWLTQGGGKKLPDDTKICFYAGVGVKTYNMLGGYPSTIQLEKDFHGSFRQCSGHLGKKVIVVHR